MLIDNSGKLTGPKDQSGVINNRLDKIGYLAKRELDEKKMAQDSDIYVRP